MENHFFFLEVGPELTFRFCEAILALAEIDRLVSGSPSRLREILLERMDARPEYWRDYYHGDEDEVRLSKLFSYSARARYCWTDPEVARALRHVPDNLQRTPPSETTVSQFFHGLEFGEIPRDPADLIRRRVLGFVRR